MILMIDTLNGTVEIGEAGDCKRLSAEVRGDGSLSAALGTLGSPDADGKHLWISIDGLRKAAAPANDAVWPSQFDAMIQYAASKGWLDGTAARVRVHWTQI